VFGLTGIFDHVVVNSKAVADEYAGYPARYRKRVVRIDHGFEPKQSNASREKARRAFDLPMGVPLIGSVARLHPQKNLAAAVRLLALRPHWHLAIAGQGQERAQLETLARTLNVSRNVHFMGELSPEGVALFLKSLDVFVFPTRMETFGLAAVEAAQAGVPVVASDIDVLREVLTLDGEPCALFVDPDYTEGFAKAVERLLTDDNLSSVLIACSHGLKERYALDAMTDRYAELIRALPHGSTAPVSH
jgi:glycosyltransferase involved in cell wall biosynthesis